MPNYRRAFVPGGCRFFTVNLLERRQTLLVDHIAILREAVATTRQNQPFTIDAFVVLPDHIHAIWTLPPDDADFPIPLAAHQEPVCEGATEAGTAQRRSGSTQRTRHLAAPLLVTSDPRSSRLRPPCRILLHQPGETRLGHARPRLAALVVSSRRPRGNCAAGLGGRSRAGRRVWRAKGYVGRVSRRCNPPTRRL